MTTREENLKKINEELEKLDDEQLDKVAGGKKMPMIEPNPNSANAQNTNHPVAYRDTNIW